MAQIEVSSQPGSGAGAGTDGSDNTRGSGGAPARAGRREWIALAVLALPLLLVSMDVSVLYFAVPFISADLHATATQQLWIFDIYGFVLAGLLITMGSLGDRIGRRRLLLIGAVGFAAASLLAAFAQNPPTLIAARALLGIGGATLMPSTLAMIRNLFHDPRQRSTAIGIWTMVSMVGVSLGPVLSGVLLEHFWWGSVFLVNLPFMIMLVVLGPILLPEFRNPRAGRLDLVSSVLSLGAVLPFVYGVKTWAEDGYGVRALAGIVVGMVLGVLFVLRQRRHLDPMIDLALFAGRRLRGALLANAVAMFALVGFAVLITQYLQLVRGFSPLTAALWSLAPAVLISVAAPGAQVAAQRFGPGPVVGCGFVLGAAGFGLLSQVRADSSFAFVIAAVTVLNSGLVAVMSVVTEVVIGAVTPERAGSASAVNETGTELGGALGIALLGSLATAAYRSRLPELLPPGLLARVPAALHDGLPGAVAASAGSSGGSAGASAGSSGGLSDASRGEVLAAGKAAFSHGMATVSVAGAVLLVLAAVLTVALLTNRSPEGPKTTGHRRLRAPRGASAVRTALR